MIHKACPGRTSMHARIQCILHMHIYTILMILMHACLYNALICDAAQILSRTNNAILRVRHYGNCCCIWYDTEVGVDRVDLVYIEGANQNAANSIVEQIPQEPPPLYKWFLAAVVSKPNPPQLTTKDVKTPRNWYCWSNDVLVCQLIQANGTFEESFREFLETVEIVETAQLYRLKIWKSMSDELQDILRGAILHQIRIFF